MYSSRFSTRLLVHVADVEAAIIADEGAQVIILDVVETRPVGIRACSSLSSSFSHSLLLLDRLRRPMISLNRTHRFRIWFHIIR